MRLHSDPVSVAGQEGWRDMKTRLLFMEPPDTPVVGHPPPRDTPEIPDGPDTSHDSGKYLKLSFIVISLSFTVITVNQPVDHLFINS